MEQGPSSRRRRASTKSVLRLPDLEHAKAAVLWGGASGHTYTLTRQPNGTLESVEREDDAVGIGPIVVQACPGAARAFSDVGGDAP
jgi:hypothetical protein